MIKLFWAGGGLLTVAAAVGLLTVAGRLSPSRPGHEARAIPTVSLPSGCHC
jgi:hypothetical protein